MAKCPLMTTVTNSKEGDKVNFLTLPWIDDGFFQFNTNKNSK
jgi:hypothetical protein